MPEATMFLSKLEQQQVADQKARHLRYAKEIEAREKAEREAARLQPQPHSSGVPAFDSDLIAKLHTDIARIRGAEKGTQGTIDLLKHAESRIQERVGDSDIDRIVNGSESATARLTALRSQIGSLEAEIVKLGDERVKKQAHIDRLREGLKESSEAKRRKLLKELSVVLDRAQRISQEIDGIYYSARDVGIELDSYASGPSMFAIPGILEGGKRLVRADSRSRYDEWKTAMIAKGIL